MTRTSDLRDLIAISTKLAGANLRMMMHDRRVLLLHIAGMIFNNLLFLGLWWVLFYLSPDMSGWKFHHVAVLQGFVALSWGLAFFTAGGSRRLSDMIRDGRMDIHLTRPIAALICVSFAECRLWSIGDVLFGLTLLTIFSGASLLQIPVLAVIVLCGAMLIQMTMLALQSISFWTKGSDGLTDALFNSFLFLVTSPQQGLPLPIKVLTFTLLPAGFVSFLPVDFLRDPQLWKLGAMLAATVFYTTAAIGFFNFSLRKYTSGSLMIDAG